MPSEGGRSRSGTSIAQAAGGLGGLGRLNLAKLVKLPRLPAMVQVPSPPPRLLYPHGGTRPPRLARNLLFERIDVVVLQDGAVRGHGDCYGRLGLLPLLFLAAHREQHSVRYALFEPPREWDPRLRFE